jgi:hypothetical protein
MDWLELIKLVLPFVMQLINLLKGQPAPVVSEALSKAHAAVRDHCDGVGCPADTVGE